MGRLAFRALHRLTIALALLFPQAASGGSASAIQPQKPASILWIGNSFTYYNGGIPAIVRALAAALKPLPARTLRMATQAIGGAHLRQHAANTSLPLEDGWDLVVVQGYSNEPILPAKAAAFTSALATLHGRIAATGAGTALFMTWAYKNHPEMSAALASAYETAGRATGAAVVPVGLAFADALSARPRLQLYVAEDNKHPSPAGTYLAACTFYAALYGGSPEPAGLVWDHLPPETAQFLEETAWQTVSRYYGWPPEGVRGSDGRLPENR